MFRKVEDFLGKVKKKCALINPHATCFTRAAGGRSLAARAGISQLESIRFGTTVPAL